MGSLWRRRPSGSLMVSVVALIVAASGTAIAPGRLVSGDKLIAKGSLSGNRLRKHTITALELNLAKVAKVPNAQGADHAATAGFATSATSATSATNATNATNATTAVTAYNATNATNAVNARNSTTLEGQLPSAFVSSNDVIRMGLVTARAGQTITLAQFPPFTMTLACSNVGGTLFADINVSSTEAQSLAAQRLLVTARAPMTVISENAPANSTLAERRRQQRVRFPRTEREELSGNPRVRVELRRPRLLRQRPDRSKLNL
jgi:hypothetical protein